jgi:dynein intermediate chain
MDSRKEELERKRQRLAELRKSREKRDTTPVVKNEKQNVDDLINSLVGTKEIEKNEEKPLEQAPNQEPETKPIEIAESITTEKPKTVKRPLGFSKTTTVEIAPTLKETYNKEVQVSNAVEKEDTLPLEEEIARLKQQYKQLLEEKNMEMQTPKEEKEAPKVELSEQDKRNIMQSDTFQTFFDHSSKLLERVLGQPHDYLKDYTAETFDSSETTRKKATLYNTFYDEKLCKNRIVTSIDWSAKVPIQHYFNLVSRVIA